MSSTRPLKVFLCHSSADKHIIQELYYQLNSEGWIDVWFDTIKLLPGQEWDIEIEKAVEDTDIVLVCLSSHSINKDGYLQKELRLVLNISDEKSEGTIFVIPLRLDDCKVPRRLSHWQYVDYFPEKQKSFAYQRLLESFEVRARKQGISIATPITQKSNLETLSKDEGTKLDESINEVPLEKTIEEFKVIPSIEYHSNSDPSTQEELETLAPLTLNLSTANEYLTNSSEIISQEIATEKGESVAEILQEEKIKITPEHIVEIFPSHEKKVDNRDLDSEDEQLNEEINWKHLTVDLIETLILAVILFFMINFISARVRVDGFSMSPTVTDGEFVLVNTLFYKFNMPEKGDVVVFYLPTNPETQIISRIIGLPGDTIIIQNGVVEVNGIILEEPYVVEPSDFEGTWIVNSDNYFLLSDNRNQALDSSDFGLVSIEDIIGKVELIYFPFQNVRILNNPSY